jgi:hypothetical protein
MNTFWFSYRGLSPHKFTPMPGVHEAVQRIRKKRVSLTFVLGKQNKQ